MLDEAEQILARVAAAYAGCQSYRDTGVVTSTMHSPRRQWTCSERFSTRFVRPGGFLFEYHPWIARSRWGHYATWIENGRARRRWSIRPPLEDAETLHSALGAAAGVSLGTSLRVPELLMPELAAQRSASPPGPARIVRNAEAASQNCIVIGLSRPHLGPGFEEQVWIDATHLFIRRVVEPRHSLPPPPPGNRIRAAQTAANSAADEPLEDETVTIYEPAFNVPMEPADLLSRPFPP
ncbi:MAG: hypothetical protein KF745_10520 [Phycisphaeraceae bacterium]|nr:hypothetical protein [Phycisphaeraceae bacterium]